MTTENQDNVGVYDKIIGLLSLSDHAIKRGWKELESGNLMSTQVQLDHVDQMIELIEDLLKQEDPSYG